jgi:hypothetical protein
MRELIYLSEAKLGQFSSSRLRRQVDQFDTEGELTTPVGKVKFGRKSGQKSIDPTAYLEKVLVELEGSDRAPKWYEDETVHTGQWVHFEAKLSFWVMPEEGFRSAVIFTMDPWEHSIRGDIQILLHGSSSHLIEGRRNTPLADRAAVAEIDLDGKMEYGPKKYYGGGGSSSGGGGGFWRDTSEYKAFDAEKRATLHTTAGLLGTTEEGESNIDWPLPDRLDPLAETIRYFHGELIGMSSRLNAIWMAGYARVTAIVPPQQEPKPAYSKLVVASPLYVEYITQPTN